MKLRNTMATLAALATIPLAAMALAQGAGPQGGPPQGLGGQGRGPGGPQGPMRVMGGPGGGARILLRPDVQRELKLTEDQIGKIREAVGGPGGPGGRGGQGRPGFGGGQGGPPPGGFGGGQGGRGGQGGPPPGGFGQGGRGGQGGPPPGGFGGGQGGPGGRGQGGPGRPPMDQEQMRKHAEEMDAKIKGILSDSQFKRYKELGLQMQGPAALAQKDLAEKIGLSEAQRLQIRGILEEGRPRFEGPSEGGQPPDPESMRKMMDQARDANNKKILAVLTSAQRTKWDSMLGQPFKFEQMQGGPGFGRGPGGQGGPGGRGGRGGQGAPPPVGGGGGGQ